MSNTEAQEATAARRDAADDCDPIDAHDHLTDAELEAYYAMRRGW